MTKRGFRVTLLLAIVALSALAGPAYAHYQSERVRVYNGSNWCAYAYAVLDHSASTVRVGSEGESVEDAPGPWSLHCMSEYAQSPGDIQTMHELWFKRYGTSTWGICFRSRWYSSTTTTFRWSAYSDLPNPPCNTGYYFTKGYAKVRENGTWYGGGERAQTSNEVFGY